MEEWEERLEYIASQSNSNVIYGLIPSSARAIKAELVRLRADLAAAIETCEALDAATGKPCNDNYPSRGPDEIPFDL